MVRNSARSQARETARKRQAVAHDDERRRMEAELDLLTEFELAKARQLAAADKVALAEADMAQAVEGLFAMGNSIEGVMSLIGETNREFIKRLRKLAPREPALSHSHTQRETAGPGSR